jgi:alpha-amylase
MGVMMQAFYWDCPKHENKEFEWWNLVREHIPSLRSVGFTALWLPPVSKAGNIGGPSMGYDPYDYYDLGEYDQKGGVPTWFGTKEALLELIAEAHVNNMQVYADLVLNHNSGADEQETNPITGETMWTKFTPASGKFARNWEAFHPSQFRLHDEHPYGGMPDLCHYNPYVFGEILKFCRYLVEEIGFDGFRYDFVKGFGVWLIDAIQGMRYVRDGVEHIKPFGVGECWDSKEAIDDWLNRVNAVSANPVRAFDFPLRGRLKDLCDTPGWSLRNLPHPGTLLTSRPSDAVTFVENHDIVRERPIINDKLMAYSFILTHEGYPCVFWQDYFTWNLAKEGTPHGIAALVEAHEKHAGGMSSVIYLDNALYIMQRNGWEEQKGLLYVLNAKPASDGWNGARVQTRWRNTSFKPIAWSENADGAPKNQTTDGSGRGEFWAPPRGYAVYIPEEAE